jgi:hypothetical protein
VPVSPAAPNASSAVLAAELLGLAAVLRSVIDSARWVCIILCAVLHFLDIVAAWTVIAR